VSRPDWESLKWDTREYESVDSTNLEARRLLGAGEAGAGLVVRADHQTAGRGRLDRRWYDAPKKSLLASFVLPYIDPFHAAALVSTSVRAALIAKGASGPSFKWPNDLVYGEKKVGGILSESCGVGDATYLIIGLGLNVSYAPGELPVSARLSAASLGIEEGGQWRAEDIFWDLLAQFESALGREWKAILAEYRRNLAYVGRSVRVEEGYSLLGHAASEDGFEAAIEGIDDTGHLILRAGYDSLKLVSGDITPL
jgi:BirA family biotin operon repressor/biotin-[acetyl-CoA-carboxylase] ligase